MSNNPYEPQPQMNENFGMGAGGGMDESILRKVAAPAIALMVAGILNILLALFGVASSAFYMSGLNPAAAAQEEQFEEIIQQNQESAEFMRSMLQFSKMMQGPLGLVNNLLACVVGVVITMGALKMKSLKSYGFSMTASILAMIPCLSSCCFVGLPIGIWALVVLLDQNVKQAFLRLPA